HSVSHSVSVPALEKAEQDQYRYAYDLLMTKRDFQQAINAFQVLLKAYPNGEYADNAQFWLGEAHYAKNELDDALKEFQELVDNYRNSPKVPDAVYKVGYIHKTRGDVEKARKVFEGLIEHYPDSPAARLAAMRLETL
ncbi:MAG TPA: tol-pal system protein YbgF, partial [Gammaproteobacteria bacterium]|nr:tol-pal system protein YbgF [Gammaproteobacteria bacterium]